MLLSYDFKIEFYNIDKLKNQLIEFLFPKKFLKL